MDPDRHGQRRRDPDGDSGAAAMMRLALLGCAIALLAGCAAPAAPTAAPAATAPAPDQTVEAADPTATALQPTAAAVGPAPMRSPTAFPAIVSEWRPPPYPAPWALRPEDHFYFSRPVPSGEVNWPHARYRYGSTYFGQESIHTGVDLGARRSTPVVAAAPGEVVWTGYGLYRGLPNPNDPYGLAIAIRHDFGYDHQPLYTVYAHLESSVVWRGQRVQEGEAIGTVGDTGHASGPHLHFEVRLGENYYFSTLNPELWIVPPEGWGVLVGRVLDAYGRPLAEHRLDVISVDTGQRWEVWTYALGTVHADPVYNENFVLGDLPAGPYEIRTLYFGRLHTAWMFLVPGQTNLSVFRGGGFQIEPTPTAGPLALD
jgi:murein DD-endopeptidase MepM/ murein hydrolase activator NlpD